jgi:hypothetical protein
MDDIRDDCRPPGVVVDQDPHKSGYRANKKQNIEGGNLSVISIIRWETKQ